MATSLGWLKVALLVLALFLMPDAVGLMMGLLPQTALYGEVIPYPAQVWVRRGLIFVVYGVLMMFLAYTQRVHAGRYVLIVFLCDRALKGLKTALFSGSWGSFGSWSAALALGSLLAWRLGVRLRKGASPSNPGLLPD